MSQFRNTILSALSEREVERLTAKGGARVELPFQKPIYQAGDRIEFVYFPEGCLMSLVRTNQDGQTVESGLCGYEGAVALTEACGSQTTSAQTVVQVGGPAWRFRHEECCALASESRRAQRAFFANAEFQLIEARQSALCRSFHQGEARMARWFLEYRKRSQVQATLPITQEFLAAMLGVQRTTVTALAREMKADGLIDYTRGKVTLLDLKGLQQISCDCGAQLDEERARVHSSLGLTNA